MTKPDFSDRLRAERAEREARECAWEKREYPFAAREAVRILSTRIARPPIDLEKWTAHIESAVRDASSVSDARDAATIAAAVEPDLRKAAEMLDRPSAFEHLKRARSAVAAFGHQTSIPGADLSDLPGQPRTGPSESPTDALVASIDAQNRARRARENARDEREARMEQALTALVGYSEAEMRAGAEREARDEERERRQEIREGAQEARERLMVRLTVGGVLVGVASVVAAVIFQ